MKRLLLILTLICMIIFPVFSQTGSLTTNEYFYLPEYGAYGTTEYDEYNTYMEIADNAIKYNKDAFDDFEVEDITDVDLTDIANLKILKYNSTSEKWECEDDGGVGYVDTSGTPVQYDIARFTDADTIEGRSYAELKADLSLEIGTDVQAYDAGLLSIAALTTSANDMIYTTALDTYAIMDTFAELQAIVADKTLVNEEDIFTIDANWVNTANPWADNEVTNDPTITIADTTDATCFPLLAEAVTGAQKVKSDAGLTYNAETGDLKATLHGGITEANLLDKTASETVTGDWYFDDVVGAEKANDSPGNTGYLIARRKRDGVPTDNVSDGDTVGALVFMGYHTGSYETGAIIYAVVDGTPGENDMPAELIFATTKDNAEVATTAMTISSTQVVTFTNDLADSEISNTLTASTCTGNSATVTFADNDDTDENNEILFAGNAAESGDCVVEADSDFHYNPSTGTITATVHAGAGGGLTVLGSAYSIDNALEAGLRNGVYSGLTVTDVTGINISWTEGVAYVDGSIFAVSADASEDIADNATTYLYVLKDNATMQENTTEPVVGVVGEFALVCVLHTYGTDIHEKFDFPHMEGALRYDMWKFLDDITPTACVSGCNTTIDTDATLANDFKVATGTYYTDVLELNTIASILYSSLVSHDGTNVTAYYHTGSAWTSGAEAGINFAQWDNGTQKTNTAANKWYTGWIFVEDGDTLIYVYPQTEHASEGAALDEAAQFPPYHQNIILPSAKFILRHGETAFGARAYFVDIRPFFGYGNGGPFAQMIYQTVTGDSGTTTATASDDSIAIVGGGIATIAVTADTVTITATEVDSVVGAVTGIVKSDGAAAFSAATIGIADDNLLEVDDADAADNDYAKFTAAGLEGRSYAEVMMDTNPVTTSATTNTLTVDEAGLVLVSDAHTETLPTASGNTGLTYHFIKTDWDYDLITLDGHDAETINYENAAGAAQITYPRLNTPLAEVTIVSDGTNWQVIDEAMGQVPDCWVYLSADQLNIVSEAWPPTKIEFDSEEYDIGSNFDAVTNYIFTAPINGTYQINAGLNWFNVIADKRYGLFIRKNDGAELQSYGHSALAAEYQQSVSYFTQLDATDFIHLGAYNAAGADTVDVNGGNRAFTYLQVKLISKD